MNPVEITLVIDPCDDELVVNDFESARIESEGVTVRTAQGSYFAEVTSVKGG